MCDDKHHLVLNTAELLPNMCDNHHVLRGTRPVLREGNVSNGVPLPDGAASLTSVGILS